MLEQSTSVAALMVALSKAQGGIENVVADTPGQDGNRTFKYATLDMALRMARPLLAKEGIALIQRPYHDRDSNYVMLETRLALGDEWISTRFPAADLSKNLRSIKEVGGAITYSRRYCLFAFLGIAAAEDDVDGDALKGEVGGKPSGSGNGSTNGHSNGSTNGTNGKAGAGGADDGGPYSNGRASNGASVTSGLAPATQAPPRQEPPVNKATGECSPHMIEPGNPINWVQWGQSFLAAVESSRTMAEIDAWVKANAGTLAIAKTDGPQFWTRLQSRTTTARDRLDDGIPEKLRRAPVKTAATPAAEQTEQDDSALLEAFDSELAKGADTDQLDKIWASQEAVIAGWAKASRDQAAGLFEAHVKRVRS